MRIVFSVILAFAAFAAGGAHANERELLRALRGQLAEQPTDVRPTALPEFYGVYFGGASQPRAFVDSQLQVLGNHAIGYSFLSGSKRGADISPEESKGLYQHMIRSIPVDRLPVKRFGDGRKTVYLFTAYDCPSCRGVEDRLTKEAKQLDVTVVIVPTALAFERDPQARASLNAVLCASDRKAAWTTLMVKRSLPQADKGCKARPEDFVYLWRVFPVRFPSSVPTALSSDGKVYPFVARDFDEIFRGG